MFKMSKYFALFLVILMISSCAKRGNISGGTKDTIAPILKESYPKNFSTKFTGNEFKLVFDEYIKLKDINKQLVISPPLNSNPVISPTSSSKYITVKFKDTLKENTTYSFNFGQSIQDNNEGNPYPQFKYIFSTGSYIDSLSVSGTISDALELKVDNFVNVMLYEMNETYNDSIIYKEKPRYITNTLDSSRAFKIDNIKAGKYLLVALKDANNNLVYDPSSDKIAFHQEPIIIDENPSNYNLKLFKEQANFKISKPNQASGNKAFIGIQGDFKKASIQISNDKELLPSMYTKMEKNDSLQIWFPKVVADSLNVSVKKDTSEYKYSFKYKDQKIDTLNISISNSGVIHLRDQISLKSSTPMTKIDLSKFKLINKDSTDVTFETVLDTLNQRLNVNFKKDPFEKYGLTILPGGISDFFDTKNDTLSYKFSTKSESEYGNLRIILSDVKSFPIIIQLTDENGVVLAEDYSEQQQLIEFNSLQPNKFMLRIIYDTNRNKKWDPGNFLNKTQSEEVIYFPKLIDVRANWDVEQPFILSD